MLATQMILHHPETGSLYNFCLASHNEAVPKAADEIEFPAKNPATQTPSINLFVAGPLDIRSIGRIPGFLSSYLGT